MFISKKWFSLVEVVMASIILTIWVFGVYKMMWFNSLLLQNTQKNVENNLLLQPVFECIENLWYSTFSWEAKDYKFNIDFGADQTDCQKLEYLDTNEQVINKFNYQLIGTITDVQSDEIEISVDIINEWTPLEWLNTITLNNL